VFISKLDVNGDFVWAKQFGGNLFETGYSLYVDKVKNVYSTGFFRGTVDFDPNAGVHNLTSYGSNDIFIHKMQQCPAVSNTALSVTTCNSYTLNNQVYTSSGNYTQVLLNADGCDSLVINLQLTITRIFTDTNAVICDGETYLAGGVYQTVAGIYYDTLINSTGCDSVIATHLTVKPSPKPDLGPDRNICFGQTLVLDPGSFSNYLWQDMSTNPVYTVSGTGTYWVSSIGTNLCTGTDTLHILAIDTLPQNFLKPTGQICPGNSYQVSVPGYKNYLWSDNTTTETFTVKRPGTYYLTVTDFNDCMGSDTTHVVRIDCIPIGIPNSFTPNGDSKNDIFRPTINQTIQSFYFVVFNRNGQKMFETREYGKGWDGTYKGKDQPVGAYVYHIKFINGIGWETVENGSVLLIR
jgi:gliding motility-associated-like protein